MSKFFRFSAVILSSAAIWSIAMPGKSIIVSPRYVWDDASYSALKAEYDLANTAYRKKLQDEAEASIKAMQERQLAAEKAAKDAVTDEDKNKAKKTARMSMSMPAMKAISAADGPGAVFCTRFLNFAVKHPKDPDVLESLNMAFATCGGPLSPNGVWARGVKFLETYEVRNPALKKEIRLFRVLAGGRDSGADQFLRDVMTKNPDRHAQGRACQALAGGRKNSERFGLALQQDERLRKNYEKTLGVDVIEKVIADLPAAQKDSSDLTNLLKSKYADVCPDLSIGSPAPEVLNHDISGAAVKLSALKGKVVVLDIWATWCGPCKEMIPHEREMVSKLKDKPFALVSISSDEQKQTLSEFLEKVSMPWTHWWNGNKGGILEDWNVEYYPTLYVLDSKGIIRYKDLRGKELEDAVEKLLGEM